MELRELRSFCVAARLRSVSKAAEHLGVGQPTVTTHIKKLEEELGKVLFDRVKRPIQLTLAGAKLAELATPLVEGLDALITSASSAEEQGPVSVASTPEVVSHVLPRVVKAFRCEYPQVHLRIRSGVRSEIQQMVEEGEVDVGIIIRPESGLPFHFQCLFAVERVLITPLGHPLLDQPLRSVDPIAQHPLILMERRTPTRTMLEDEFRRKRLAYDIVLELDSMDAIKRYVAVGMGISIIPRLALEAEDERTLGVVSLATLLPVDQAGLVTLRGKSFSPPVHNFLRVAVETLAPVRARP